MSDLYNRIAGLCEQQGITITAMCKDSGASRASLSDLKVGRKQSLSAETLDKIANYFDTTVDYLLGRTDDPENNDRFGLDISDDEIRDIERKEKVPTPEGEHDLTAAVIFGRDGKMIKRTYSKEQMDTVYKLLDAIPHKDEDI